MIKLEYRLNTSLDPQNPLETKSAGAKLEIQHSRKGKASKVIPEIKS